MRTRFLLVFFLIIATVPATAQDIFQRSIELRGEITWGTIRQIGDNRFILASGDVDSTMPTGMRLTGMRLTAFRKDGTVEWSRHYGNSDEHVPTAFARGNGKYFIAGGIAEPGSGSLHRVEVIATDTEGNILWARSLNFPGGDFLVSGIASTSDGGAVVIGQMIDDTPYSPLFIARFDGGGNLLWGHLHKTQEHLASAANDIIETTNGFVICGTVMSGDRTESDALVMRIDGEGKILWANRYEKGANEIAQRIIRTDSGGYAFIGSTDDLFTLTPYAVNLDSAGGIIWSATLSISTAIEEKGIAISAIGGGHLALLTGTDLLNPGDNAVRMTVISNSGATLFSREYSPEEEKGRYSGWVEPSGDGFLISASVRRRIDGNDPRRWKWNRRLQSDSEL